MKVEYIDDSPMIRTWLISMIPSDIKDKLEIFQASNGEEGIEIFMKEHPKVVFLDLTMPKVNGFEVLDKIKKESSDVTVVIVSADRQQITLDKVMKAGASLVLNKPIDASKKALYIGLLEAELNE